MIVVLLYFFYYRTKPNSTAGYFLSKTAWIHTWTLLLVMLVKLIFVSEIQSVALKWIYTNFLNEVTRCWIWFCSIVEKIYLYKPYFSTPEQKIIFNKERIICVSSKKNRQKIHSYNSAYILRRLTFKKVNKSLPSLSKK